MALTRRDGYATLFVGAGLLLALSVIQGWGWPLMNGTRMGIIALGAAGMFACSVSGWAGPNVSYANPFMIIGILLAIAWVTWQALTQAYSPVFNLFNKF